MKYEGARLRIRNGDVIAWRGQSCIGRLIRLVTGEPYSHVALALWVHGRLMAVEAVEGRGVVMRPISQRLPVYWVSSDEIAQPNWRQVLGRLGQDYSYGDAIRAGLGLRPIHVGWQCAEFVVEAFANRGIHGSKLPGAPTPGSVVKWLQGLGARVEMLEAS